MPQKGHLVQDFAVDPELRERLFANLRVDATKLALEPQDSKRIARAVGRMACGVHLVNDPILDVPKLGVRLRLLKKGKATVKDETIRVGTLADHTLQGDGGDGVPFSSCSVAHTMWPVLVITVNQPFLWCSERGAFRL